MGSSRCVLCTGVCASLRTHGCRRSAHKASAARHTCPSPRSSHAMFVCVLWVLFRGVQMLRQEFEQLLNVMFAAGTTMDKADMQRLKDR